MIGAVALAAGAVASGAGELRAAFPSASVIESPASGRLTHASGFEAAGLGDTPENAARAFLERYGAAFGVTERQDLVARGAPAPGTAGAVRFERRIGSWPVFDGDLVVGVDAKGAVILVNGGDVPPATAGSARVSRRSAVRAAKSALSAMRPEERRAERGWRASGQVLRPVWRVDLVTAHPSGDWRTYVDAETGKVLFRSDLRRSAALR